MFQYVLIWVFLFQCFGFSIYVSVFLETSVFFRIHFYELSFSWNKLAIIEPTQILFSRVDTGSLRSETNTFRLKIYPQFAIMYRQLQMPALYIYCIHCNSDSNDIATIDGGFNMLSPDYFISSKFSSIVKELVSIYVWCHFICCMSWWYCSLWQ